MLFSYYFPLDLLKGHSNKPDQEEPFYYGAGHVHALEQRHLKVEELARDLQLHGFGALFFCEKFSLLVYPTETEDWSFLDEHYIKEINSPVSLRFVMFRPIPEFIGCKTREVNIQDNDEPLINRFFRETYNLDYKAFVPGEKKGSALDIDTFFMLYPTSKKDEHDLIVSFLEANKATVYSSYTPSAWDYILREVPNTIILVSKLQAFWIKALRL